MRHVRRVAVLALVAVAGAGCSKGDTRSADSAAGASAAQSPAQSLVSQQRAAARGDLTKPLDQYTGAELSAFVNSLTYVRPVTRPRRCRDDAGCGGATPTRNTQVRVEAVGGQDSIGGTNIGPYGTVVSRGRNLGQAREERYGMRQGNRYQYVLIILPDTGGANRWQIQQLDAVGNNQSHTILATGRVRGCGHPFVAADPRVDFRRCEEGPLIRQASFQGGPIDPPWWYSCYPQGCCEVSDQ